MYKIEEIKASEGETVESVIPAAKEEEIPDGSKSVRLSRR